MSIQRWPSNNDPWTKGTLICPPPLVASRHHGLPRTSALMFRVGPTSCVTLTGNSSRKFIMRMIQTGDQRQSC